MIRLIRLLVVILLFTLIAVFLFFGYTKLRNTQSIKEQIKNYKAMVITSSAFKNNEFLPRKYTCNGENTNPPLEFSEVPPEAKSLVLIVDDPDARGWVHWVVFNINPEIREIGENSLPEGGIEGVTSFGEASYGGPCPPSGTHRYFFKLYALDKVLSIEGTADKNSVLDAMDGAIIDQAELIGLYSQK